jgi:hypothetical protein
VASITIDPREIMRFSAPESAEPSELREAAQKMEQLAVMVENMWDEMPPPPEVREALVALAYTSMQPPKGIVGRYRAAIRGGISYARIKLRGEQEAFFDFVEGAFSDLEQSRALTPEDTLDQLRQLSDEALRELR